MSERGSMMQTLCFGRPFPWELEGKEKRKTGKTAVTHKTLRSTVAPATSPPLLNLFLHVLGLK